VADDGFDGRTSAEFPFDLAGNVAFLSPTEDPSRPGQVVPPIGGIDIGPSVAGPLNGCMLPSDRGLDQLS